jgi:hypothetical protein
MRAMDWCGGRSSAEAKPDCFDGRRLTYNRAGAEGGHLSRGAHVVSRPSVG